MAVRGRGSRDREIRYLGCSAAGVHGGCHSSRYYRINEIEAKLLPRLADEVVDDRRPKNDPIEALTKQITKLQADADKLAHAYERAMLRSGELAERTAAKLEREHADTLTTKGKLEREVATLHIAKPASTQQAKVHRVLDKALAGDVAARGKIAEALPSLIKRVIFHPKSLRVEGVWRTARGTPWGWSVKLDERNAR